MELKLWPWDKEHEKPFFKNEIYEWWIEKDMYRKDKLPHIIPFILKNTETQKPEFRILMNKNTNSIVWKGTALEAEAVFMDMLYASEILK